MSEVFLLCVVAILRPVAHKDVSHITLFWLPQIQGQMEGRGGVKVLKKEDFAIFRCCCFTTGDVKANQGCVKCSPSAVLF